MSTPEQDLWAAVVHQAIYEATEQDEATKPKKPKKPSDPNTNKKAKAANAALRTRARRWLLGDSDDFRAVCEYAGLDPDAVRERLQKQLKKPRIA